MNLLKHINNSFESKKTPKRIPECFCKAKFRGNKHIILPFLSNNFSSFECWKKKIEAIAPNEKK